MGIMCEWFDNLRGKFNTRDRAGQYSLYRCSDNHDQRIPQINEKKSAESVDVNLCCSGCAPLDGYGKL